MEQQVERRAIFLRPDPVIDADTRNPVSQDLYREAGKRGFSTWTIRSSITGGYNAEIMHHFKTGRVTVDESGSEWPEWRATPNVAMGTGRGPLEAALDGYIKVVPSDPIWACVVLQVQIELLRQTVVNARKIEEREAAMWAKLDWALIDLTNMLDDVNPER